MHDRVRLLALMDDGNPLSGAERKAALARLRLNQWRTVLRLLRSRGARTAALDYWRKSEVSLGSLFEARFARDVADPLETSERMS